jgi:glutamine synthetase
MSLMHNYTPPKVIQPNHKYQAMYIWVDGRKPTAKMRSKTRILEAGEDPPIWGFDGSSTEQAEGHNSDCVLVPVFICRDTILGGDNLLVLCEVYLPGGEPHSSNTRARLRETVARYGDQEPLFGLEQEYTFLDGNLPYSWPTKGAPAPQGGYYCGVGSDEALGRGIVEEHLEACLNAGLQFAGTNPEVMPAQWEFQVGPLPPLEVADQLWMARWILYRITEKYGISATLHPKPMRGDWNGAGCHTNFSTREMRAAGGYPAIIAACEALGRRVALHVENYGDGIEERLTGRHETSRPYEFSYGVSDRGASIRIPWQVEKEQRGYLEDRRPNANCDPYVTTRLIIETVCGANSDATGVEPR